MLLAKGSMDSPNLLTASNATFGYAGRAVVRVDDLRLCRGRCVGVFGPNGAGKTTLVRGLSGLIHPTAGTVDRAAGDVRFGYLSQYRGIDASWPMTGFDAAAMASSARSRFGWIGRAAREQIVAKMARLDVAALAGEPFATLSGGQQQRLLLAGALAAGPQVLVLDEPTDGLDVRSRSALLALLRDLSADGLCVAIISHDLEDLLAVADEVAWLHPAEAAGEPSRVETVMPAAMADRILTVRRPA